MFNRRTVFILGAGSSAEVDLPQGKKLAGIIGKKMDIRFEFGSKQIGTGDMDLYAHLTGNLQREVQEYQNAGWLIRDGIGLVQSIDDFLDVHRSNKYVNLYGKAAIVKTILEAEKNSKLYFAGPDSGAESLNLEKLSDTWFVKFVHVLARGLPKENVRQIFDSVSFINFNYDRCVEHFLINALQKLFGISADDSRSIVDDLNIIHPYGVVGDVQFGSTRANYAELAKAIKTYTEQIVTSELRDRLQNEIDQAQCIVTLGFAYHDQNMRIIQPGDPMSERPVFGTAFGMSDSDVDVTADQIDSWFVKSDRDVRRSRLIHLENKLKCADLFDFYAKSLTGGGA
jgi:hypothetical protein